MFNINANILIGGGGRLPTRFTKAGKAYRYKSAVLSGAEAAREADKLARRPFDYINSGAFRDDVMVRAAARVKKRTVEGKGYTGRKFADYKKDPKTGKSRYKEWKKRQGRYRGKVDLWLYGGMLNAIRAFPVTPLKGVLRVLPAMQRAPRGGKSRITVRELARIHHRGEGNMPKRPFFAWRRGTPEDRKLKQTMRALMMRQVRRAGRGAHGVPFRPSSRSITTTLT